MEALDGIGAGSDVDVDVTVTGEPIKPAGLPLTTIVPGVRRSERATDVSKPDPQPDTQAAITRQLTTGIRERFVLHLKHIRDFLA